MSPLLNTTRVRFAPAPTGYLHVGSARAALFNWMFARSTGGTFVLRIEDTDTERSRHDLVEGIERSLRWLGLDWDEGPIRQSSRLELYRGAADRLLADDFAYYCDCTRDEITARSTAGYDGFCLDRGLQAGAVRFRTPDEGETSIHDMIRGQVTFAHDSLEDFVILRSDGTPGFLLANAVDDATMNITHVIRGEDLLPSTPRVLLLRRALGFTDDPAYAHLPVIVNEKRQKLSKRRDDVALEEFRERGYLPEAMRNYLALLGWGPADGREIVPIDEMVAEFRLQDVKASPAFFDVVKLDHINGEYLRAMPNGEFVARALPWLETTPPWPPERFDLAAFISIAPVVQPRVRTLAEVPSMVDFLFLEQPVIDPAAWEKGVTGLPAAAAILGAAVAAFANCEWEAITLHDETLRIGMTHGLKLGKAQAPIRVAVTGRGVGPPLFESLVVLGRPATLARLGEAQARL